jgi:SAM-dependent methyltransferase
MTSPSAAAISQFPTPSSFFAWCIQTTGDRDIPFRENYPQYFQSQSSAYLWKSYDRRLADIIQLNRPGLRVLEVGCGIGSDLHWLALRGAKVVGIDVKSEWIAAARKLTEHVESELAPVSVDIRRTNLLDMPDDEKFDLIYMKDTFHHLEPRSAIVEKLASLLSDGGSIVIVEPNAWNPLIQLKMFRIRGFNTIVVKKDVATGETFTYGNERLVSGGSIARAFRSVGVQGSTRLFRLVPTAWSLNGPIVTIARFLEGTPLEAMLVPACIHCVYRGHKGSDRTRT